MIQLLEVETFVSREPSIASGGTVTRLPDLLTLDAEVPPSLQDLHERREDILRDLTENMMADPSLGSTGFQHRWVIAERGGEDVEPYVEQALRIASEIQFPPGELAYYFIFTRRSRSLDDVWQQRSLYDPKQFLVRHAWRTDDRRLLDDVLAAAETAGDVEHEPALTQRYIDLYFSAEEDFTEAARRYVAAIVEQYQDAAKRQPMASGCTCVCVAATDRVIAIWRERELDINITDVALHPIVEITERQTLCDIPRYLNDYTRDLWERRGEQDVVALYRDLARALIGPRDEQSRIVTEEYDPLDANQSTASRHIDAYLVHVSRHMEHDPALMLIALEEYSRLGAIPRSRQLGMAQLDALIRGDENADVSREQLDQLGLDPDDADAVGFVPLIELLQRSRLTAEAESFIPYINRVDDDTESILHELAEHLDPETTRGRVVRRWLEASSEPTFGKGLLLAMTSPEPGPAVYDYLGEHSDALDTMPSDRFAALALVVEDIWSEQIEPADLSGAAQAAYKRLGQLHNDEWDERLNHLLVAEDLSQLGVNMYDLADYLRPMLLYLAEWEPDRVGEALHKSIALMRAQRKALIGSGYPNAAIHGFVNDLADDATLDLRVHLAMTLRDATATPFEFETIDRRSLGGRLAAVPDDHEAPHVNLEAQLERIAPLIDDGDVSFTLLPLLALHEDEDIPLQEIAAWANLEDATPMGRLKRKSGQLAVLLAGESDDAVAESPDYQRAADALGQMLEDRDLSITYRLGIASRLAKAISNEQVDLAAARLLSIVMAETETHALREQRVAIVEHALLDEGIERGASWLALAEAVIKADSRNAAETSDRFRDVAEVMRQLSQAIADRQAVASLMEGDRDEMGPRASLWLDLLRQGQAELAAELLSEYADEADLTLSEDIHYNETFATQAYQLLTRLEDPAERYFAELILAALPDADDFAGPSRTLRMAPLIARWDRLQDRPALQERAVDLVTVHDDGLMLMADQVAEQVEPLDITSVLNGASESADADPEVGRQQRALVFRHLRAQALRGNFDPVCSQIEAILPERDQRRRDRLRESSQQLIGLLVETTLHRTAHLTVEHFAELRPTVRFLTKVPRQRQLRLRPYEEDIESLDMLSRIAAGDEPPSPKDPRERMMQRSRRSWQPFLRQVADLLLKPAPVDMQVRVEFLGQLFQYDTARAMLGPNGDGLASLEEAGLFDNDSYFKHGETLATLGPRGGQTWAELAVRYERFGRRDDADAAWNKAFDAVEHLFDIAMIRRHLSEVQRDHLIREPLEAYEPLNDQERQAKQRMLDSLPER